MNLSIITVMLNLVIMLITMLLNRIMTALRCAI